MVAQAVRTTTYKMQTKKEVEFNLYLGIVASNLRNNEILHQTVISEIILETITWKSFTAITINVRNGAHGTFISSCFL